MLRRAALVVVILAPTLPAVAWAQVTPDRATMLQQQIQDWLQNTLGIMPKPVRPLVRVTAAGDHFDLTAPLNNAPDAPVLTGNMTDAGNGRWNVDNVSIPSPSVFKYKLLVSKTPGAPSSAPSGELTSTLTVGSQQQHLLLDPTFVTPSTSTSMIKDLLISTTGTGLTQLTHIDSGSGTGTMTPVADGRVDVAVNSGIEGYSLKMSGGTDQSPIALTMGKVSVVANLAGVARDRAMDIVHELSTKMPMAAASTGTKAPDDQNMAALLISLADLAKSGSLDEKVNDVSLTMQNLTGTLKLLSIGLTSSTTDGKLQARLPLAAEGLTLPDIGLGSMVTLVPSKLAFTPSIGAVPTEALMRMSRKFATKQDPAEGDIAALFSQGPITVGVEDLSLEVAGTGFTGTVSALVSSPEKFSGTGKITAVDIDKLQQAVAANPQTAQFGAVLIFLKGVGRSEQSRLVWDMNYADGRLLVNGQDMAALMGQPAQPTPPPAAIPARPRPPARK